jgi:predicted nucleic acid-binding protein
VALLVDTGILYALADTDDGWHSRVREYFQDGREVLLVPVTVTVEVAYLLREHLSVAAEHEFIASLAMGELGVEMLTAADWKLCTAVMEKYPSIGFVDASIVAIGERRKLRRIATTDRRHFRQVRPTHVDAFELVP